MCNDYERHIEWAAYEKALAEAQLGTTSAANPAELSQADDVRVNDTAPIIVASGNVVEITPMRWGFTLQRAGGPPVFNFKSDNRDFTNSRRCLIPASAFFEFTGKASPKTKWRFDLRGSPVFAVAGLWRDDGQGKAFTMLTTSPGPDVAPYHDRQIVVLPPARWGDWLYLSAADPALVAPLPAGSLAVRMARQGKDPVPPALIERAHTP
jgi:putative SOS response-associated peptidase YedK